MRRRQVLKQFYFAVEMDEKCFVLGVGEHLVEKDFAGTPLLVQNISLTQASVDEQSESKRQVCVLGEILDHLRAPVFLEDEIVLGQIANDLAFLSRTVTGSVTTLTSTDIVATP